MTMIIIAVSIPVTGLFVIHLYFIVIYLFIYLLSNIPPQPCLNVCTCLSSFHRYRVCPNVSLFENIGLRKKISYI